MGYMRTITAFILCAAIAAAQSLPVSTPEQEGMSSERFRRLHARFGEMVEKGSRAGAATLVLRNGKVVDLQTYGYRDIGRKLPMDKDTICRIWSMTKVITSVAAMMLVEEGKLTLAEPVSKHVPELKQMRVLTGGTADAPVLTDAARQITVKHLLTHTSGLTYTWGNDPVPELYRRVKIFEAPSLKAFIAKVASVPLLAQPGEKYNYGINTDVLGYVVEVASGMPFDKFVQSRILTPLGMNDTHWVVPEEKLSRLAKTYTVKDGKLGETSLDDVAVPAGVPYGGMGLYSTIGDYARFGQMLLNGGQLNGVRLLSRKTVELMTGNHLSTLKVPSIDPNGGYGFGLGGSVRLEVAKGNAPGSTGQFGWDGAASTSFRMDPKEKLVTVLFQQYMPFDSPSIELFSTLVYQAIVD
jgi:CubicO group peptidase (beta-lactamase class C family)